MQALADRSMAPRLLKHIDQKGRPIYCLVLQLLVGCIAFISELDVSKVLVDWLLALSSLSFFFIWLSINLAHIRKSLALFSILHTTNHVNNQPLATCRSHDPYTTLISLTYFSSHRLPGSLVSRRLHRAPTTLPCRFRHLGLLLRHPNQHPRSRRELLHRVVSPGARTKRGALLQKLLSWTGSGSVLLNLEV